MANPMIPEEMLDPPVEDYTEMRPMHGGREAKPLDSYEVKSIVSAEIQDAVGRQGSEISEERRRAIRMYNGRPMGNEIRDRSQVQTLDVLEVVEWTMPSLMNVFMSGQGVFQFHPANPEDQKNADLASAYINHVLMNELDGQRIFYDWMKTALLEKNGIVKPYWEETRSPTVHHYTGLTEDELTMKLQSPDIEVLAQEEIFDERLGMPTFDITIREWEVKKGIKIDGIPPEEFLIARRTQSLVDDPPFTAHRKKMTISQLVAMGFSWDEVSGLPSDDTSGNRPESTERFYEDHIAITVNAERSDPASREVWVTECYIRIDEDGDGFSELRKMLVVGEDSIVILDDEEVDCHPFFSICPVPMPHKFFGKSLADLVMDLQTIRSTILRQVLDHVYLSVNPRMGVVNGMANLDDLLTVRPGGLVRMRSPDALVPIVVPPLPREAFETMAYLEEVRANRTGVIAHGSELDASAINSTATGLAQLMAEKQQKIKLIARLFSNPHSGIGGLGRRMLKLMVENDTKEHQLKVNGEWVQFNPSHWDPEMSVSVEMGLGAGQAIERLNNLERIGQVQSQIMSAGGLGDMVTRSNIFQLAKRIAETSGYANPELFFSDPSAKEPPPPPPNPDMVKIEADAKKHEAELELKRYELELGMAKEEGIQRHRSEELELKRELGMEQIAMQERVALGQQDATIEAANINADGREQESGNDGQGTSAGDSE